MNVRKAYTTMCSQRYLDALAIDNPLEYARLVLSGEMQTWVEAMDEEWDIGQLQVTGVMFAPVICI